MEMTLPPSRARTPVARQSPPAPSSLRASKLGAPWAQGCSWKGFLGPRGLTILFHRQGCWPGPPASPSSRFRHVTVMRVVTSASASASGLHGPAPWASLGARPERPC